MVKYSEICEDTLEYIRDKLRNDIYLCGTTLGLSGTSEARNHIFAGRPKDERISPTSKPNFKLPRIVIDLINNIRSKVGLNQDGFNDSQVDVQIASWISNSNWSAGLKVNDRISYILENDSMPVEGGFARFEVTAGDVIDDPDREQTKMATLQVKVLVFGGNT